MVRLDEQDKQRIYVIKKTAEDMKLGSWADCETIYNLLSEESRSQETLSKAYRQLDKAEMGRATRTPAWNATRVQVRQWLHDRFSWVLDESSSRGFEPGDERPAYPDTMQTLSFSQAMWGQAMQVGPNDGSSASWEVPCWFTNLGATVEQSLCEASPSYDTISVDSSASTASAVIPYSHSVDTYNGATSGFIEASPAWLSLDGPGTEALDSLAMNTYNFSIPQAPFQQTVSVRDVGTEAMFDRSFAEAAQRASSTSLSGQARHAAYSTAGLPSSYTGANMLVNATHVAVDNTYVDSVEHGLPDSPTLGRFTTSTELEQLAGGTVSESFHYQTPLFSEYPHLSAEMVNQVDMLAWDDAQMALSLDNLEQLLAAEEFDSSGI